MPLSGKYLSAAEWEVWFRDRFNDLLPILGDEWVKMGREVLAHRWGGDYGRLVIMQELLNMARQEYGQAPYKLIRVPKRGDSTGAENEGSWNERNTNTAGFMRRVRRGTAPLNNYLLDTRIPAKEAAKGSANRKGSGDVRSWYERE